tara:strand:+ start:719 stop:976 length:258 start_codon:yes stop_codon:yes gene_type:complete
VKLPALFKFVAAGGGGGAGPVGFAGGGTSGIGGTERTGASGIGGAERTGTRLLSLDDADKLAAISLLFCLFRSGAAFVLGGVSVV